MMNNVVKKFSPGPSWKGGFGASSPIIGLIFLGLSKLSRGDTKLTQPIVGENSRVQWEMQPPMRKIDSLWGLGLDGIVQILFN